MGCRQNNLVQGVSFKIRCFILSSLINDAADIINRYQSSTSVGLDDTIFSPLTNQYVNRCLKVIKEICEIEIPLTFHVARHTFAKTVALKNGVPLETVQLMMGHTKISTTLIYADVDEEKILKDMAGIEDKLQVKRDVVIEKLRGPLLRTTQLYNSSTCQS
jgi:integrase